MIKKLMILVFLQISFSHGYLIYSMRDDQQITYNFKADIYEYDSDTIFDYGLWSRYTPLSKINQVGTVGILDSHCFHLHSATESQTQRVNFISYDCLEAETQKIKRIIQFIADDGKLYKYEQSIKKLEYEFTWHYFQILVWPKQKRLELILIQYPETFLYEILSIQFPYNDIYLLLKFGGGFIVNDQIDQSLILDTKQFSYLPGTLQLHPLLKQQQKVGLQNDQIAIGTFQDASMFICECNLNQQLNILDQDLSRFDHKVYVSEYTNCDSFALSTWIKIDKIYQVDQDFLYQFIKISANFESPLLIDDNLSAFQLFYKISSIQNQLIFTTYSYSLPLVLIDFTKDSFLIRKNFDIKNEINTWQYLSVQLKENLMSISLTFYQESNKYIYQTEETVNQFHLIQFKMQYGNNFQQSQNYLDIKIRDMIFTNCLQGDIPIRSCHFSCKDCDGPTKNDCLSCHEDSKRIYLPESKACICPFDLMDTQECKSYNDFQLQLQFLKEKEEKCKYGYFKISQDTCIRCPSIIQENLITCLECIENPQSWILDPYCSTNLFLDKAGSPAKYIKDQCKIYFIYDGNDLNALNSCWVVYKNNIDFIFDAYLNLDQTILQFCTTFTKNVCIQYDIENCQIVGLSITQIYCVKCIMPSEISGVCKISLPGSNTDQQCITPNYLTSDQRCQFCPIEYCIYCFEYYSNELSKSTLYLDFESFPITEFHNIGCALCNPGFIFDFTNRTCQKKQPQIENCLRSYINLQGQEICTLSQIENFNIASEIFNCQKLIQNCLQCLLTLQKILICVICDVGYKTVSVTGHCDICNVQNAQICVEVYTSIDNGWNQIIKSFTLSFLPDKYQYPFSTVVQEMITVPLTCVDGYQPFRWECQKYCDPNCLKCNKEDNPFDGFKCEKCALNYYQLPIRVQNKGRCLTCPPLCQICEIRSANDIKAINPNYIITQFNEMFTYKCLQSFLNPNIRVDPYLQIAQLCYNENCSFGLQLEIQFSCDPNTVSLFFPSWEGYYEGKINKEYGNRIGLQTIIIHLKYLTYNKRCFFPIPNEIRNDLKTHIFSLQQVQLIYEGFDDSQNKFDPQIYLTNFDKVEIHRMKFIVPSQFLLNFENQQNAVDITIVDTLICKLSRDVSNLAINSSGFNNFKIQNVSLININVTDSTIFDMKLIFKGENVIIKHFSILNCTILNTIVFNFFNITRNMIIEDLIIESSEFINSTYLYLNLLGQNKTKIIIKNVTINFCMFSQSNFLNSSGAYQYFIQNITLNSNMFDNSNLLLVNSQIQISDIFVINSILINTQFLISNYLMEQQSNSLMEKMIIAQSQFSNFSLLTSISSCQINNEINFSLNNLQFLENRRLDLNQQYIFNITCQLQLTIFDVIISNSLNLNYFYLFNIQSIIIYNVTYSNEIQLQKIPLTLNCFDSNYDQYNPQLLQIYGVKQLEIRQINIFNQFSIDQPLIQILTNIFFQPNIIERIEISDIYFFGNILLKTSIGNYLSSIAIYSEKRQEINLKNLIFKENSQNQYIDDPSLSSTTLIYINSQQSDIVITNLICQNNALTNSSSSFISLYANSISFNNVTVHGHNMQNYLMWNKYYDISILNLEHMIKANQIINAKFLIKTKGGALSLTTANCTIKNGVFSDIQAYSSGVISIKSQGAGFISLYNVDIISVSIIQSDGGDSDGCISIQAQNSLLSLFLTHITFNSVQNVLSSSILTIEPSLKKNYIKLQNIKVLNCFSLLNQLMKIEFKLSTPDNNQIFIYNLMVQQSEENWLSYLQNINPLKAIEIKKIANDNVLIQLSSCHVTITKLTITGIYISSIIKIIDSPLVFFTNIYFYQMNYLNFINIIYIAQISSIKQVIIFQDILIQSLDYYQINALNTSNQTNFTIQFQSTNQQCTQDNSHIQIFTYNTLNIRSFLTELQKTPQTDGSIFYFQSNSNQSILSISQMQIINVECKWCLNGLIYFELNDFQKINIQELFCLQNSIIQNGCVVAKSLSNQKNILTLKQSLFILNQGKIGTAIKSEHLRFSINQCRFFNNSATQQGGAIYLLQNNDSFVFKQTLIVNNKAREAGGLYLYGSSSLNESNFVKSKIFLNKAELNSNNLKAIPVSLELSINKLQMRSISIDAVTKTLILKPYKMLEQGKVIQATQLKVPSNQKINNYKIFDSVNLQYETYIQEFSISLRNSLNEQLPNLIEHTCQINLQILENNKLVQSTFVSKMTFNNDSSNFDLGSQLFTIDPYNLKDQINEILITCQTENQTQKLFYSFVVQPLKCQLGEFYVDSGCQLCEPNQGFYSVIYDALKCSIFDPSKFDQITSNLIKIKKGFWRPIFQSDNVEYCFKNQDTCQGGWLVGDSMCQSGYLGGLCEECDKYDLRGDGVYFKQKKATTCDLCDSYSVSILPFITSSIWAIVSNLLTLKSINKSNKLFQALKLRQKFAKIIFKFEQDHESILIKLFLNYLWIFSVIFTFNITFSFSFSFIDQTSNPSHFMANSLDCYLQVLTEYELIYVRIIAMLILMGSQILLIYIGFQLGAMIRKRKIDSSIFSITLLYLYVSNYAALITQFCSILAKRSISKIDYIQGDVSLVYGTQSHIMWMIGFVSPGLGLFGIFFPFSVFLILYFNKGQLDKIQFRKHLCYLFNEYNDNNYFWEWVKLWKKSILIFISIYFETDIFLKAALLGLCLLFYQLLAARNKPFSIEKFNTLDVQSVQICSISIFLAVVKYVSEQKSNQISSIILQIIITLLCIKLCYPFLSKILKVYIKKYKLLLIIYIHKLFNYIFKNSSLTKYLKKKLDLQKQQEQKLRQHIAKLHSYFALISKHEGQQQKKSLNLLFTSQTQTLIA